jgi:hypothetical protein
MSAELHRGKLARHPRILSVRSLTRDDLARLYEKRVGPPRVKQFRDTHHRLARMCAAGLRDAEIIRLSGYGPNRLMQLRQDPAFQQLIAEYRDKVTEAFVRSQDEFYETSVSNMLRAERMIEDHLDSAEETGETVPLKTLLAITSDRADRFGYGKHRTQTNENVNFAAEMKRIAQQSGRSNVIDARPLPVDASTPQGSSERVPAETAPLSVGFRRRA